VAATSPALQTVVLARDGVVARITLNRPDKRNALSLELMEELIGALDQVAAEP
jgi:enoyl-CoA hydratase/carnithine racemase